MAGTQLEVHLAPAAQLAEALQSDDDWTGITDAGERRRRQNRLNQRARRRRKFKQKISSLSLETGVISYQHEGAKRDGNIGSTSSPQQHSQILDSRVGIFAIISPHPKAIVAPATPKVLKIPSEFYFPLTPDHLIHLIQYNVLRAVLTNYFLITGTFSVPQYCTSAHRVLPQSVSTFLPHQLGPTRVQQEREHPLWMDLFPLPQLRNNLITLAGSYDAHDLCHDLVGNIFQECLDGCGRQEQQDAHRENNQEAPEAQGGLIAWGDPWDIASWEMTGELLKKWGPLLIGCQELVVCTNRWREVRGEESLNFDFGFEGCNSFEATRNCLVGSAAGTLSSERATNFANP